MLGLEAWLSLIGPAYFAYIGIAIPFVVVWAIICAALWIWNNRPSKRRFEQPPARLKCEACLEPVLVLAS